MARVSKQSLTAEEQDKLITQLTEVIGRLNNSLAQHFLFEFFGREEKIMLAKRLAIITLIHEQQPLHRIAVHLHVSETTVGKLCERYNRNEFEHTIKVLTKNKTDYKQFLDLLDSILTVGGMMPRRNYIRKSKQ